MPAIVESIEISRRPEDVFAYSSDFAHFPEWQGGALVGTPEGDAPPAVGSRAVVTRRIGPRELPRTEEIAELNPPRSWVVRGVGGRLVAIAKGTIEPLDGSDRSRVTIAIAFEGHGIGRPLVPLLSRQARKQLPKNEQMLKEILERPPQPGQVNTSLPPILVCYDGSAGAARAIHAAATLLPGRPAIVLYITSPVVPERARTTSVERVREELIEEVRVAARREAAAVAEEGAHIAWRAGLEANPLVVETGDGPADAIVRVARKESAAAVVLGRPSRTRLGSLLPGRVSRSIVDHCPVPVVVV
jgi:nucleotide-binding universal stress UspA family protein